MVVPSSHYFIWQDELYKVSAEVMPEGIRITISKAGQSEPVLTRTVDYASLRLTNRPKEDFEAIIRLMLDAEDELMALKH